MEPIVAPPAHPSREQRPAHGKPGPADRSGAGNGGAHTGSERERDKHWREVGVGAQILRDLGVSSITLLTARQTGYVGLAGFEIEIAGTERLEA